jgi:hypothetical protein
MTPRRARARWAPRAGLAAGLALSLALGGCSFYKVRPPPPTSTWPQPVLPSSSELSCTNMYGAPFADTIVGGMAGTITYIERGAGSRTITAAFGIGTVVYLASAIWGYVQVTRCKHYQSLFRDAEQ